MKALTVLLLVMGCAQPVRVPAPRIVVPLPRDDPRQALVGDWEIQFVADTVAWVDSTKGQPGMSWRRPSPDTVTGRVRIRDSLDNWMSASPALLRGFLDVDFHPILGRPLSCYKRNSDVIEVTVRGDSVHLLFTPYFADCGLSASGMIQRDEIVGKWLEPSYGGGTAWGRFKMRRISTY
jgi:hypothetical protein